MTDLLYLKDCYLKECESRVVESGEGWAVLDRTVFYPTGGGQEHDTGTITFDGRDVRVVDVRKDHGEAKHFLADKITISIGTKIKCAVDWDRRYKNMRMHIAQHLVSAVVIDLFGASTVGNQIYPDKSRIDFAPAKFSDTDLIKIEEKSNEVIAQNRKVNIKELPRAEALEILDPKRTNVALVPKIPVLRMIEIEGYDICPCGGTHVKNTKEIGRVRIVECENKGASTQRVTYVLD